MTNAAETELVAKIKASCVKYLLIAVTVEWLYQLYTNSYG